MILSIILITIFILFISYFLVLYYYNNNKIVSLHTYKNENEIFSHSNSIVNNDIKYTKPIETVTTPPQPNTELINKQKLILDAIILNLKELNSLGAIDGSLTDKLDAIKRSSFVCTTPTFTNFNFDNPNYLDIIINLTDSLPIDVSYNKDDLIPPIKKLINLLPTKDDIITYTISDLITPIKTLISNLPNKISYDIIDLIPSIKILISNLPNKSKSLSYNISDLITPIQKLISNLPDKAPGIVDYYIIDLIPSIKILISNLPEKYSDAVTYNKNDLLPYITSLTNKLPIPNKQEKLDYNVDELLTPIDILVGIKNDIKGDMLKSVDAKCFKDQFKLSVGNVNKFYSQIPNNDITLLYLYQYDQDYINIIMEQIYGDYKHLCENV